MAQAVHLHVFECILKLLHPFMPFVTEELWQGQDLYKSKQVRDKQIVRILGKAPTIAAAAYLRLAGRPPVLPSSNLSYSENFLYMLDSMGDRSYKPNPRLARVLDILFILHAEHEMNCSTAAARHLASRQYTVILLRMDKFIPSICNLNKSAFAVVLTYIQPLLEQLEPCMVLFMVEQMRWPISSQIPDWICVPDHTS